MKETGVNAIIVVLTFSSCLSVHSTAINKHHHHHTGIHLIKSCHMQLSTMVPHLTAPPCDVYDDGTGRLKVLYG